MQTLDTTNLLLGIIAAVSALEAILLVGLSVFAFVMLRRGVRAARRFEAQQVTPALGRLNAILEDAKDVAATVREETERIDPFVRATVSTMEALVGRHRSAHRPNGRAM